MEEVHRIVSGRWLYVIGPRAVLEVAGRRFMLEAPHPNKDAALARAEVDAISLELRIRAALREGGYRPYDGVWTPPLSPVIASGPPSQRRPLWED